MASCVVASPALRGTAATARKGRRVTSLKNVAERGERFPRGGGARRGADEGVSFWWRMASPVGVTVGSRRSSPDRVRALLGDQEVRLRVTAPSRVSWFTFRPLAKWIVAIFLFLQPNKLFFVFLCVFFDSPAPIPPTPCPPPTPHASGSSRARDRVFAVSSYSSEANTSLSPHGPSTHIPHVSTKAC